MADEDRPGRDAIEGLGLLFRAGRGAAKRLKKNLAGTDVAKSIDDAGREVARALDNVVARLGGEKGPKPRHEEDEGAPKDTEEKDEHAKDEKRGA